MKKILHGIVAVTAIALGVFVHLMVADMFSEQSLTWQGVVFMTSHALIMLSVVCQHTKLALQGLHFQFPVKVSG